MKIKLGGINMKTNKSISLLIILATYIVITLCSCTQSPADKLVGEWVWNGEVGGTLVGKITYTFEKNEDNYIGSVKIFNGSSGQTSSFEFESVEISDTELTYTFANGKTKTEAYEIHDDKLIIDEYEFIKQ